MKKLLLALSVVIITIGGGSSNAFAADRSAQITGGTIVLHDTACTNKAILEHILPQWHAQFKSGTAVILDPEMRKQIGADTKALCWIENEAAVFVVNELGGQFPLDPAMFKATGPNA